MTNTALIPDEHGTLRRVFGGGLTVDAQEQIRQLQDQLAIVRQGAEQEAARHQHERAQMLATLAGERLSRPPVVDTTPLRQMAERSTAQLKTLRDAREQLKTQLSQAQESYRRVADLIKHERLRNAAELKVQEQRYSEMLQRLRVSEGECAKLKAETFGVRMAHQWQLRKSSRLQVQVDTAHQRIALLLRLAPPSDIPTINQGTRTNTYQLLPSINIDTLVGATSAEPLNQELLDLYALIKRLPHGNLPSAIPMAMGGSLARNIVVPADGVADRALAAFPTLLRKV